MTTIDICSICREKPGTWEYYLEGHQAKSDVVHLFEKTCFRKWWIIKKSCPLCNCDLTNVPLIQVLNPHRSRIKSSVKWIEDQILWSSKKIMALSLTTAATMGCFQIALIIHRFSSEIFTRMLIGSISTIIPLMVSVKFAGNHVGNQNRLPTAALLGQLLSIFFMGYVRIDRISTTVGVIFGSAIASTAANGLVRLNLFSGREVIYIVNNNRGIPSEQILECISMLCCAASGAIAGGRFAFSQTESLGLLTQSTALISGMVLGMVLGILSSLATALTLEIIRLRNTANTYA